MGDKSQVRVNFLGDTAALAAAAAKARAQLASVGKQADKESGLIGRSFGRIGGAAKAGIAGVMTGGLLAGGKAIFDMGTKMELMEAKSKTVFGNQIGVVQRWAKANAAAMGLTSREATTLSANFADLLIPMGFTREAAAKMSTDVVGLSGALSQWSGGTRSAAEVSEILAKAMLGERDGLKELGISISDADVKARLLKNGWSKLTGVALQQATATVTQTLIMEKSTDAQAAYAKGAGTLAGKKAVLTARIKELRDSAIAALIPKLQQLSDWISTTGVPMVQRFAQGFKDGSGAGGQLRSSLETVKTAAKAVADVLIPMLRWIATHPALFKSVAEGALALAVALKLQAIWGTIVARLMPGLAAGTAAQGAAASAAAVANARNARAMMAGRSAALLFGAAAIYAANKWAAAMNASVEAQSKNEDRAVADSNMADVLVMARGMGSKKGWDKGAFQKLVDSGNVAAVAQFISNFKKGKPQKSAGKSSSRVPSAGAVPAWVPPAGSFDLGGGGKKAAPKMVSAYKATFDGIRVLLKSSAKMTLDAAKSVAERAAGVAARALAPLDRAIEASKARLAKLREQSSALRELARSNAASFASVLGFKAEDGQATTAGDVLASMKERLAKVREFAANMQALAKAGLNKTSFQELLSAGVEGGGAIASALVGGGAGAVGDLNSLQGEVNSASSQLGAFGSSFMYGSDIEKEKARLAKMEAKRKDLGTITIKVKGNDGRTIQTELLRLKRELGGNLGLA